MYGGETMTQNQVLSREISNDPARKRSAHHVITEQIVEAIEVGAGTFSMPWHRDAVDAIPMNALTGNAYNGINILALWIAAMRRDFSTAYWASYRQWRQLDAQVQKGEKGSVVVFYKRTELDSSNVSGDGEKPKELLVARSTYVFNADQVEGWHPPKPDLIDKTERLANVDDFVSATAADIQTGGSEASYSPRIDQIRMPDRERFTGSESIGATEAYYATLLHELTHWTGHSTRLARDLSNRFGQDAYAMEELIAELGAAFLCAELQISNQPRSDHAAYIASWLHVLGEDSRAIFLAAAKANEAKQFLMDLQPVSKQENRSGMFADKGSGVGHFPP
jgi:antirestriction protein ArdC